MKMDTGLTRKFVKWSGLPAKSLVAAYHASAGDSSAQIPNPPRPNSDMPTSPQPLNRLARGNRALCVKNPHAFVVRKRISCGLFDNSQVVLVVLDCREKNGKRLAGSLPDASLRKLKSQLAVILTHSV